MRNRFITLTSCLVFASSGVLSGCSQISGWLKSDSASKAEVKQTALRSTPDQSYQFSDGSYGAQQSYSGYDVVLYDTAYVPDIVYPPVDYKPVDPTTAAFVKLNGTSDNSDWRNCETRSRGYLLISGYDFSFDPDFEVCMRNEGYVLATEAGVYAVNPISAKTAGLRGISRPGYIQSSNSYPSSYSYP